MHTKNIQTEEMTSEKELLARGLDKGFLLFLPDNLSYINKHKSVHM